MAGSSISSKRRSVRNAALVAAVGVAALLSMAAPGLAQTQSRQSYELKFTTGAPNSSSGTTLAIDYRDPRDPERKPPAVETIVQRLHPGTVIDTSVPPRCEASDVQLIAQGPAACPPETRVGGGELSVDIGAATGPVPRIVRNRVTFFNADEELILVTESTNTEGPPIRTSSRVEIDGRTMTSRVPPFPGIDPEDPFLAIKRVRTQLDEISSGRGAERKSFIETPDRCPSDGTWTSVGIFTYRDGVTQVERNSSPCIRGTGLDGQDEQSPEEGQRANDDVPEPAQPGDGQRANDGAPESTQFPRGGVETGRVAATEPGPDKSGQLAVGIALVALAGAGMLGLRRRV